MDTDLADEALKNAQQMLAREGLTWIAESSLHLRAFYWGLYCGLGKKATEADRNRIALEVVTETMSARTGDDPFRRTELGVYFNGICEELRRHVETNHRIRAMQARSAQCRMSEGQTLENQIEEPSVLPIAELSTLLSPLLSSVQRLADRWRDELNRVQEALQTAVDKSASPEETLRTLQHLEESMRFLTAAGTSQ